MATTVASVANPLGVALGFVFPTFFVTKDTYDDQKEAQRLIESSLLW